MARVTDAQLARNVRLHSALDELLADWLRAHPTRGLTDLKMFELLEWSYERTQTSGV